MKYKIGDVIYCINNDGVGCNLIINKKYTVLGFGQFGGLIVCKRTDIPFQDSRFISDKEYQINNRKLKLIKLKNEIQNRRHSLLY